jgi:predicted transcriptional regulator
VNELPTGAQVRVLQLYVKLARELKRNPSEQELADAHGSVKNNIRQYIKSLKEKGLIEPIYEQRVVGYEITEAGKKWAKVQL